MGGRSESLQRVVDVASSMQCMQRIFVMLTVWMITVVAAAAEHRIRCLTEDDIDGVACRVDMLPDEGLAHMVYERWVKSSIVKVCPLDTVDVDHTKGEKQPQQLLYPRVRDFREVVSCAVILGVSGGRSTVSCQRWDKAALKIFASWVEIQHRSCMRGDPYWLSFYVNRMVYRLHAINHETLEKRG